jgi:hypothetical protein
MVNPITRRMHMCTQQIVNGVRKRPFCTDQVFMDMDGLLETPTI